jgi:hypothetical protein
MVAEVSYQEQASNHPKRQLLRVVVVSVEEKLEIDFSEVGIRKMNASESP